jgi:outer membrane protein OmpA-like peptidoglycan-associated protein
MLYKTGALLLVFGLVACQSSDKPAAFSEAKEAISNAESDDVDDVLPRSMELAHQQYSDANKMWLGADDLEKNKKVGEANQQHDEAVRLAISAKKIAKNGSEVVSLINQWDRNLQAFADFRKGEGNTNIVNQPANNGQIFIGELLSKVPLVFFETAHATVDSRYEFLIDQVAKFLSDNPTAQVTLSGYADVRGDPEFNRELSQQRATAVADILKSAGVQNQQIVVEGLGEAEIAGNDPAQAQMQLARKVEASIQLEVAH